MFMMFIQTLGKRSLFNATALDVTHLSQRYQSRTAYREHDLRQYTCDDDYSLTTIDNGTRAYMTIQKSGIKVKDYLILNIDDELKYYQVEDTDYYIEPDDMCMLALRRV